MIDIPFIELAKVAEAYDIEPHKGWHGVFTTKQSRFALFKNRSRVMKRVVDGGGDLHGVGATGRVLGSICHAGKVGYFIEWDASPKTATFCIEEKLTGVK
jgi:hypothetical protein